MDMHTEFTGWLNVFNQLKGCKIEYPFKENARRAMIANGYSVPWASALKPQYNEMPNKIGYIDEQAKGIRLDIDFLPSTISENQLREFMTGYPTILEVDRDNKAPLTKSYWRYKVGTDFNTFTLCLRDGEIQKFDKVSPEFLLMLQNIVSCT